MLGNQRRLVAIDERLEPPEMRFVEWLRAANRHANPVERNGVVVTDSVKCGMGRAAGTHVVFSMDLKEAISLLVGQDRLQMFMLEAGARTARNGMRRKAEGCRSLRRGAHRQSFHCHLPFPARRPAYDR